MAKTNNKQAARPKKGPTSKPAAAPGSSKTSKDGKPAKKGRPTPFSHFEEQRLDRLREKDERKAKKEEKLLLRKKERTKKLKILTKKNRKGQPLMNGRMEMLLEQIKKRV